MHRFFVPSADRTGTVVALPDDEAAHVTRVLRLKAGDAIRVFDGRGREWDAQVDQISRQAVAVRIGDAVVPAPEPQVSIALAVAVLKGDKMDNVVRDAVMMGVTAIRPVITERTEIGARAVERSARVARWQRIAVASVKQCGRAVVPPILNVCGVTDALAASSSTRIVLAEPHAGGTGTVQLHAVPRLTPIELFVGPEGGWTDSELGYAVQAGAMLVTLGGQTLRADAAPLVAITALRVLWGDL
jgi:16S rRNA (uracil1498-N3)-methyltransferase